VTSGTTRSALPNCKRYGLFSCGLVGAHRHPVAPRHGVESVIFRTFAGSRMIADLEGVVSGTEHPSA